MLFQQHDPPRQPKLTPDTFHKGGQPSAAPPLCGILSIGSEQSTCPSSQHSTCLASQQGRRHMSYVSTLRYAQFSSPTQRKPQRGGRPKASPPLWRRPKAASFVLAVNTWHILVLSRKTCALLRANAALLRPKTCLESLDMCYVQSQYKGDMRLRFSTFCSASRGPKTK